jgi:hypothetical protein
MRVAVLSSLAVVLAACGGSPKPAADPSDTSSLDSSESPPIAASPASSDSAPSGPSLPSSAPASSAATVTSAAPAAPTSSHPVPGSTGSIDGQPFSPKLAQVAGAMQTDGRLVIVLSEGSDCVAPGGAKPGDASMRLIVPWKDGYKVDLASLLRAKGANLREAAFVRVGPDGKNKVSSTFKPTGMLTVVSAPTQQNAFGKLKIDLQNGDYILAGDLDVKVCVAP